MLKRVFYMTYDIIFFFYQWLYGIVKWGRINPGSGTRIFHTGLATCFFYLGPAPAFFSHKIYSSERHHILYGAYS